MYHTWPETYVLATLRMEEFVAEAERRRQVGRPVRRTPAVVLTLRRAVGAALVRAGEVVQGPAAALRTAR